MSEMEDYQPQQMETHGSRTSQRGRTLLIGAGIGALTGLAAAVLLNRRAAKGDGDVSMTPGDGIKIGLLVLGLLRSIASLAEEK